MRVAGRVSGDDVRMGDESNGDATGDPRILTGDRADGEFSSGNKVRKGSWSVSSSSAPANKMSVSVTTVSVVVSGIATVLESVALLLGFVSEAVGNTVM